jgi:glycosyltransferase involved in cell wall biosynthesis
MKLLVISAAFPPVRAGEADHAMHLCRHLAEHGFDVHVLTTKRERLNETHPFTLHPIMPALSKQFPRLNGTGTVIPPPPLLRIFPEQNGSAHRIGRQKLGVMPTDFLIAYYGYIYEGKGIETLLEALHIINREGSNTRLVIIGGNIGENHGSSYLDKIHQLSNRLGIAQKIIWTGEYASDSDRPSLYFRAADACVFPFVSGVTLNRSSVAAAAAHGLPIVTTRGEILESPFVDGENVFLCPPRDPQSIAAALESLITNPALRQKLSTGALKLAAQYFSWQSALERTIQALRA